MPLVLGFFVRRPPAIVATGRIRKEWAGSRAAVRRTDMDLFWLFYRLSALQPVITQRLLEASANGLSESLSSNESRASSARASARRTISFSRFPLCSVHRHQRQRGNPARYPMTDDKISFGPGAAHAGWSECWPRRRLRAPVSKHKGKVTVFVPHYAMSGERLISLARTRLSCASIPFWARLNRSWANIRAASIVKAVHQNRRRSRRQDADSGRSSREALVQMHIK